MYDEENRQESEQMGVAPAAPPRRAPGGGWAGKLALAVSGLALVLAAVALYLVLSERDGAGDVSLPAGPETFQYGGQTLEVLEGMPQNPYDRAGFSVDDRGRVTYETDGRTAKVGIDVSVHQGEIDWPAVAADGVDFAMIRLGYRGYTEGGLIPDARFGENIRGALDAGLEVGAYFFSQAVNAQEAEEEADYVLAALEGYELTYPVAFDWEPIAAGQGARTEGVTGEEMTRCAVAFCERIQAAGYTPAVYFNQHLGYLEYDLRELTDYTLWLAEYDEKPDFYYHFDLWQYTHTGAVDGIQGSVDLDLDFRGIQS